MARYDPSNSDNTYRGELPAGDGLVLSRNTMSVRIGVWAGLDSIRETIVRSGLSQNPPRFPSLCLGAFESNLKDLTASYTVFATGGVKLQPYLIERIADPDGQTIYKATHGKLSIVEPEAARADRFPDAGSPHARNRRQGSATRTPSRRGRKDRNDQRLSGCVVRGLRRPARLRRVGWL